MTLFLVVRMQVNYAESRLRHKLFPLNAWMRVTNFNVLKSCPKTLLRTYYPCHCPQIHKGQTSTLRDRVGTSNSAVLTDLARDRAEAAMYMRSTLGFGTLASPSLVLPVSLLLKRKRSARGAGLTQQRAPGRPGGPRNVQPRQMLTYDIHKPVIYLSYTTGQ